MNWAIRSVEQRRQGRGRSLVGRMVCAVIASMAVLSGLGIAKVGALPPPGAPAGLGMAPVLATGTVTGTVTVTGAPKGFTPPFLGAGACPTSTPPGQICSSPQFALANGTKYTLVLTSGSWRLEGFYELGPYGGAFLGSAKTVQVVAGKTVTLNLAIPYKAPGTVKGSITVTGVPSGITIEQYFAVLCPAYAPFTGGTPSIACVQVYSPPSPTGGSYDVSTLPPVGWTVYPGYYTVFGQTLAIKAGVKVTVKSNQTQTVNVTTPYITPSNGILTGTLAITGAPTGFSGPTGVYACPSTQGQACSVFGYFFGSYSLPLAKGTWTIRPFYLDQPFFNAVLGAKHSVTVSAGTITTLNLTVAYVVPGTAAGALNITGVPSGVTIEQYTVLACPASAPWTGGQPSFECVREFSGIGASGFVSVAAEKVAGSSHRALASAPAPVTQPPYNQYRLPTLTPGSWILYPGYLTVFEAYTTTTGTKVTVTANHTTTKNLTVAYHAPADGAVTGTVAVVGAPANGGIQVGAEACTAPPTPTTCAGAHFAYAFSGSTYQLPLPPGTWWVSGTAFVYSFGTPQTYLSPPTKLTVAAGVATTADFTVTIS